jgi:hypothetical protein
VWILFSIATLLFTALALRSMRRGAPSLVRRLELGSLLFLLATACVLVILATPVRDDVLGSFELMPMIVLLFLSPALLLRQERKRPPLDAATLGATLRRFGPFRGRRHPPVGTRAPVELLILISLAASAMAVVELVPPTGFATVVVSLLALASSFTIATLARRFGVSR